MKRSVFFIAINLLFVSIYCFSNRLYANPTIAVCGVKDAPSINEEVFVESAGTKLYLKIKGQDKTKPVILFLHGGPGDIYLGLLSFEVYAGKELEKDFVVAYLHQRGMVNSPLVADSTQTIKNHVKDVENVVNFLTKKLDVNKINLMGHSWGGLLGFYYLMTNDNKIEKFIAVASPINLAKTNQRSYDATLEWAKAENNPAAIADLTGKAMPPYDFDKQLIKNIWAGQAGGKINKNFSVAKIASETEFKVFKKEWQITQMNVVRALFDEINQSNIENQINKTSIPILFIAGKNDTYVTANCVKDAYNIYNSQKELHIFENSHHLVYVDEPSLFVKTTKDFISR